MLSIITLLATKNAIAVTNKALPLVNDLNDSLRAILQLNEAHPLELMRSITLNAVAVDSACLLEAIRLGDVAATMPPISATLCVNPVSHNASSHLANPAAERSWAYSMSLALP